MKTENARMRKIENNVCRLRERCCVWMKRTRIKSTKSKLKNIRLFTDFGGIGFYKIIKIYEWKEYCNNAVTPSGSYWFKCSMAKIKTESGVIMKIPFVELGMKSVYADTGEKVLK